MTDARMSAQSQITSTTQMLAEGQRGPWPDLIVVLGSGLVEVIDGMEIQAEWCYADLPGFPRTTVHGHVGTLSVGELDGVPLSVLQGREHYYEHGHADAMAVPIRVLRALGAGSLLMTNAVGSVNTAVPPGNLVLISDHINLSGANPLVGMSEDGNSRFVDMTDAYDGMWREELKRAAGVADVGLAEGIYACFSGPSFETPAEIRAARVLGADTVGMSVVAETILARQCGLRVAAISVVTNFAAGIADEPLGHQQTMDAAKLAAPRCARLLRQYLRDARAGKSSLRLR